MKTVFTNGCFDILHRGHVELFKFCKYLDSNTKVIVGLNSDASVRRLKGDSRPVNKQADRYEVLHALKYVDEVIIFEDDTPYQLIKEIKPDILVKGGDYNLQDIVGKDLVKETLIFNFIPGYSTTSILKRYENNYM